VEALPLRLSPGVDLRAALETEVANRSQRAGFVVSGIGSLRGARLRLAGAGEPVDLHGDLEILTLAGTVASNGSHLHMSVADCDGRVIGGHVARGCTVRTTVELLLLILPEWSFDRALDPATGFAELVVSRLDPHAV
jgi:predicted DNA-binding protein with PD1-like motif